MRRRGDEVGGWGEGGVARYLQRRHLGGQPPLSLHPLRAVCRVVARLGRDAPVDLGLLG